MISNELLKQKILDSAFNGTLIENDLTLPPIDVEEIKEAVPFEIPNNWKWVKISSIGTIIGGGTPSTAVKDYWDGNISWITPADMKKDNKYIDYGNKNITELGLIKSSVKLMPKNTIIISSRAPIGYVKISLNEVTTSQGCKSIIPNSYMNSEYIYYYISSIKDYLDSIGTGATFKEISGKKLSNVLFPLPPLEQQKRIVCKIEELFNLIDKKGKNDGEKEKLKNLFKEKILDNAIHGRLVENDLTLLPIDVEEIKEEVPFEIPNNWHWSSFDKLAIKISDGTHITPKYVSDGIPFLSVKDMSDGKLHFDNCKYISKKDHDVLYKRCDPKKNDLLITKVGTTGIPVIVDTDKEFSIFVSVAQLRFNLEKVNLKYIRYVVLSKFVQNIISENTKGAANKNWVIKDIKKTPIPLPPLEQQKKIVSKIEELFSLVDKL